MTVGASIKVFERKDTQFCVSFLSKTIILAPVAVTVGAKH